MLYKTTLVIACAQIGGIAHASSTLAGSATPSGIHGRRALTALALAKALWRGAATRAYRMSMRDKRACSYRAEKKRARASVKKKWAPDGRYHENVAGNGV